ncbi:MAG TPA: ABC transporter permease [Epulopiscium sp.]|nr:ABC transporter permease [Candidatus Epulonipiscium sp.]
MNLAFSIARRFLNSNKGQTLLIVIGIAIGVSVQIFIGSLIDGLQRSLVDTTIGSSSHITIIPRGNEDYFDTQEVLIVNLKADKRFSAVSKALDSPALVLANEESYPILIRGLKFADANKIYDFRDKIMSGRIPQRRSEVMFGKDLVQKMGVSLGDQVEITTQGARAATVEIVGIYDFKVASINSSWAVMTLENAEYLLDKQNELTAIETQIEDVFSADIIADDVGVLLSSDALEVTNWKSQNQQLLSGLAGQSASSYMIQVFVLLAVLLGISSVLAISVVQKSRQIGILKAMGIKDSTASLIFLFQGLILGTIGAIIGTGLGIGLTYVFSKFVKNPDGTSLVPFYLDYTFITGSVIIAIVSSTLAALIPARKSSKLNPIEVIKNG